MRDFLRKFMLIFPENLTLHLSCCKVINKKCNYKRKILLFLHTFTLFCAIAACYAFSIKRLEKKRTKYDFDLRQRNGNSPKTNRKNNKRPTPTKESGLFVSCESENRPSTQRSSIFRKNKIHYFNESLSPHQSQRYYLACPSRHSLVVDPTQYKFRCSTQQVCGNPCLHENREPS